MVFLYAPLAVAVLYAFSAKPLLAWPFEGWSLQWFEKLFSERQFRRALATSFEVAAWTAVSSTVIGTAAAFVFTRRKSRLTAVATNPERPARHAAWGLHRHRLRRADGLVRARAGQAHDRRRAHGGRDAVGGAGDDGASADLRSRPRCRGSRPRRIADAGAAAGVAADPSAGAHWLGIARLRLVFRRDAGDDIHRGQRDDRAALYHRAAAPGCRSLRQRGGGVAADHPVDHLHRRGAVAAPIGVAFGPRR